MEQAKPTAAAFPASLAWVERGASLIRRMNSERIAEDPRLRRALLRPAGGGDRDGGAALAAIQEAEGEGGDDEKDKDKEEGKEEEEDKAPPPTSLSSQESFEEVEAAKDEDDVKQESENVASNAYRVLLWTYRLQASLQSTLQYALFAKASEDGYFIPIAPRYGCTCASTATASAHDVACT